MSRILVLVLGGLLLPPLPAPVPGPEGADPLDPAVDDTEAGPESCFTLEPPGPGWRALTPTELHELMPEALVGLAGPRGIRSFLLAGAVESTGLEASLRATFDDQGLERVTVVFMEETEIAGHRALRGMVSGRRGGAWLRCHAVVLRQGKHLYRLVSWGRGDLVPADGSAFEEVPAGLRLIEGVSLETLPRGGRHPDDEGPGWRIREGVFTDAAVGYEIAPRGPWRVASTEELAPLDDLAAAGLVSEQLDALLGVAVDRLPGVDQAGHMRRCKRLALGEAFASGGLEFEVAGRRVDFRQATLPAIPGTPDETRLLAYAVFFEGDLCVQLMARYPASRSDRVRAAMPQALASLRLLPEDERAALAAALRGRPAKLDGVGRGWALRNRTYTSFTHGLRWTAPPGFWEVRSLEGLSGVEAGAIAGLVERELGVRGTILVSPAEGRDEASWHAAASEPLIALPADGPLPVAELDLGQVGGRVSWGPARDGSGLYVVVATCLRGDRAFRFVLGVASQREREAAGALSAAVSGLSIAAGPMPPTEMRGGDYVDLRLGFALRSPHPTWRFREAPIFHYGPHAEPADGVLVGFEGTEGRGVYAAAIWSESAEGRNPPPLSVPSTLRSVIALPDREPDETGPATLRGLDCQLLTWSEEHRRIDVALLRRNRTALVVCTVAPAGDAEARSWLTGFHLLD